MPDALSHHDSRKVVLWPFVLAISLIAVIASGYVWIYHLPAWKQQWFIDGWVGRLQRQHQVGAMGAFASQVVEHRFLDGTTAVAAHACVCSGGGLDATIIANQSGKVYYTTQHVCGKEELVGYLNRAGGFDDFLTRSGKSWKSVP